MSEFSGIIFLEKMATAQILQGHYVVVVALFALSLFAPCNSANHAPHGSMHHERVARLLKAAARNGRTEELKN
jgi:hypothetical protein